MQSNKLINGRDLILLNVILITMIIVLIFIVLWLLSINTKYEMEIKKLQREKDSLNGRINVLYSANEINNFLIRELRDKKSEIPKGIKEAVRYAMIKAHPDNGGSSDDFQKFRNLYEKL